MEGLTRVRCGRLLIGQKIDRVLEAQVGSDVGETQMALGSELMSHTRSRNAKLPVIPCTALSHVPCAFILWCFAYLYHFFIWSITNEGWIINSVCTVLYTPSDRKIVSIADFVLINTKFIYTKSQTLFSNYIYIFKWSCIYIYSNEVVYMKP
jgi:hypothetical protein